MPALLLFVAASAVHLFYWMVLRSGFARIRRLSAKGSGAFPMSVIVAAKNEEKNLPDLLEALSSQTHPEYEVVVVDDGSTDRTAEIVRKWPDVRLISAGGGGKKKALAAGIEAASNEYLAFTDADCIPPHGWLASLAAEHREGEERVVVGYSPFTTSDTGLPGRLASYETFVTGFLTAAAVGLGRPYMAVGRNLSYSRTLFRKVGGFSAIEHSLSGDDDLFLQHVVRRKAARVVATLDPASFVMTPAPTTWREWIIQKRRHASGGRYYSLPTQIHLALFHGTGVAIWLAPLFLGWMGFALLALKLAVQAVVLRSAAAVLGASEQIRLQPILEPLYVLYNVLVVPVGLAKMPEKW